MDQQDRASSILDAALRILSPEEREVFLSEACGEDTDLRRQVELGLQNVSATAAFADGARSEGELAATAEAGQVCDGDEEQIGPYKIVERLGEGGMGMVYVAQQEKPLRRKVALKLIKPGMDSKSVIARFDAERQALAVMDHPNIAKVLDAGTSRKGRPYFVMELVRGQEITHYCDEHRLDLASRLQLFAQVCQAIQHAHQKGIIHRDIKPSNVLVGEVDGKPIPKVIDFGVAKAIGHSLTDNTIHTGLQALIGTPLYMSPEQAAGGRVDIDTRSDVYSLGVLLYELLTGFTPFEKQVLREAAQNEVLRIIREQRPPKPSTRISKLGQEARGVSEARSADLVALGRSVRGELDWIVMKALEKDRTRRYETAQQFVVDIENHLAGRAVIAGPPSTWYQLSKTMRRHRKGLTGVFCVIALLLVIAGILFRNNQQLTEALADVQRAESEARSLNQFFINDLLGQADPNQNPYQEKTTVVTLLDRASLEIWESLAFADQPLVEATVRSVIGTSYYALGKWNESEKHLSRAVELRREFLGENDPKTLEVFSKLVDVQIELEDLETASESVESLIEGYRYLGGESDSDFSKALLIKSRVLLLTGNYKEAEDLARNVLASCENGSLQEEELLLRARQAVADVLTLQFKGFDEARAMYEQNIAAIREDGRDEISYEMLTVKLRLGECLIAAGETDQAEKLYQEILFARAEKTLPSDHPHTILTRATLGLAQINQGKFDAAAENLRSAYKQALTTLGEHHQTTWLTRRGLIMLNSLGIVFSPNRMEVADEALKMARENVAVVAAQGWPKHHSNSYQTNVDLGMALAVHGAVERSEAGLLGAFAIPEHLKEAETLFTELFKNRTERKGATHIETVGSGMQLLQVKALTGANIQDMEKLARDLLIASDGLPSGFPVRANVCNVLGKLLDASNRSAEADAFLSEYFQFCRDSTNVSQLDRLTAVKGIIDCRVHQGKEVEIRTEELTGGTVYRAKVTREQSIPVLIARAGWGAAQRTSDEYYNNDQSLMYLTPKNDIKLSLLGLSLADAPPSGSFQLDVTACDLTKEESNVGSLGTNGEVDYLNHEFPRHRSEISMKSGCLYRIVVTSSDFHPLLRIEGPDRLLLKWTPSGGGSDASIDFIPPVDGEYSLVIIPDERSGEGEFTRQVQEYSGSDSD